MARLYSNENFPLPVVEELRRLGHDVLTVQEAGKGEQAIEDAQVLAFATSLEHAGIIVCTFDADFTGQAGRIDAAILEQPELAGQLVRVNRPMRAD